MYGGLHVNNAFPRGTRTNVVRPSFLVYKWPFGPLDQIFIGLHGFAAYMPAILLKH